MEANYFLKVITKSGFRGDLLERYGFALRGEPIDQSPSVSFANVTLSEQTLYQ